MSEHGTCLCLYKWSDRKRIAIILFLGLCLINSLSDNVRNLIIPPFWFAGHQTKSAAPRLPTSRSIPGCSFFSSCVVTRTGICFPSNFLVKISKKEIARLLKDGKEEKARIKVEQVRASTRVMCFCLCVCVAYCHNTAELAVHLTRPLPQRMSLREARRKQASLAVILRTVQ